jgi:hypothetical protein
LPVFELGFIGAKLMFPLNNPRAFQFALDGLDVSVKVDPVIVSGSFMKVGIEYAGSLTIDLPKASFSAMGFYGSMRVFNMSRESEIITDLNRGNVHKKLLAKLTENKLTPIAHKPIAHAYAPGEWELTTIDNKRYTVTDDDDKLNVLRKDKTFFIYAMLNAASGGGLTLGPIQFTGIAFGYGYNRRAKIPRIEKVAEFPLVQMVMSEGGYQDEDTSLELHKQLAKPLEDPVSVLEKMKDHVVAELGQQFACGGARFTVGGVVDCFALIVVQWGGGEIEISLLGLARFRHTRDLTARAICYVEMQILMTIKPKEGTFKLQALLTKSSWIINTDCKLTGGFALFVWFDGDHKGDLVLTLGGYHPRFRRPEHYPVVPRLGLNWPVNDNLSIKGGIYLAITPSCGMLGAKLEATFHSRRISAWFTAYLDVIIDIADKVPLEMVADGEFSVLVANRFPPQGANTVYLISLEGWNYLLDAPDQSQAESRLRLITLGSWGFVNDPAGHDTFGGLMQQLKNNSAVFSVALPATSGYGYVDTALERGYVPLDYKPLESSPTVAWYRGPLAPLVRQRLTQPPFERADAALIFDESKGIMDVSYAAAWELGRMLALSSPAFAKGLSLFVECRHNAAEFATEIKTFLEQHRSSFKDPDSVGQQPKSEQITIAD